MKHALQGWLAKIALRWDMRETDYAKAAQGLSETFRETVIRKELAKLLDDYLEKPCFETALALMKHDPKFVDWFGRFGKRKPIKWEDISK